MMPDRVVSHLKKSFGTNDLYLPEEMIEKMSSIATVNAEFIDHTDPDRYIYTGWEKLLKEQLAPIPQLGTGYTKNHFYEFADGQVSIRHIVGSEIKYVHNYIIKGTESTIKKKI
jgi:histidinol phosphatase-like PHP family hydrolase